MVNPFIPLSQALAHLLGDRTGRTTSRVIGQTISDGTGLAHWGGTQVGHVAMVGVVAAGLTAAGVVTATNKVRRNAGTATAITLAALAVAFALGRRR